MTIFFGEPWPSGICEEGTQVEIPVGQDCELCREAIQPWDRGTFIGTLSGLMPMHRECSLRNVLGGIGHLTDHAKWCVGGHDPDGGLSYRESAIKVWTYMAERGL